MLANVYIYIALLLRLCMAKRLLKRFLNILRALAFKLFGNGKRNAFESYGMNIHFGSNEDTQKNNTE